MNTQVAYAVAGLYPRSSTSRVRRSLAEQGGVRASRQSLRHVSKHHLTPLSDLETFTSFETGEYGARLLQQKRTRAVPRTSTRRQHSPVANLLDPSVASAISESAHIVSWGQASLSVLEGVSITTPAAYFTAAADVFTLVSSIAIFTGMGATVWLTSSLGGISRDGSEIQAPGDNIDWDGDGGTGDWGGDGGGGGRVYKTADWGDPGDGEPMAKAWNVLIRPVLHRIFLICAATTATYLILDFQLPGATDPHEETWPGVISVSGMLLSLCLLPYSTYACTILPPVTAASWRLGNWLLTPRSSIDAGDIVQDMPFVPATSAKVALDPALRDRLTIINGNPEVVQLVLQPQEEVSVEPGAMCYMSPTVKLETSLGEGGIMAGFQRVLAGEPLFINTFRNRGRAKGFIGLSAPNPYDKIVAINLQKYGGEIMCSRDAYMCSMGEVEVTATVRRRSMTGVLLGGLKSPFFVLQRLAGSGVACITGSGSVVEKQLYPEQEIVVNADSILALSKTMRYRLQLVGSPLSALLGREGCYVARIKCVGPDPGMALLQPLQAAKQDTDIVMTTR